MLEETVDFFEQEVEKRDPGSRAAPHKPCSTTGSSQPPTGIVDTLRSLYGPQADLKMMKARLHDAKSGLKFFQEKKQQYLDKADSYTVAMLLVQVGTGTSSLQVELTLALCVCWEACQHTLQHLCWVWEQNRCYVCSFVLVIQTAWHRMFQRRSHVSSNCCA